MSWTRRNFLEALGAAGGATAVYEAMTAMGLIRIPEAFGDDRAPCPQPNRPGASVVILGAGIAGLTAAYEMAKAGWTVTVLEAQDRIGGRNFTVRQGSVIREIDEDGRLVEQTCKFDKGLYLNAGPGRIPYHHTAVLRYCRLLEVPLEVYDMSTSANLFQTERAFFTKAEPRRRIENDTRGYVAELLAKVVNRGALDRELSPDDKAALLSLLTSFGTLDVNRYYAYVGSQRSGYTVQPAVTTPGVEEKPLGFQQLLRSQFWLHRFYQPEDYEWQRTLFQPVGGMDGIVNGFVKRIPAGII
ncbi:MAG TPA: FAD-dependent oxidoreductase, partial [Thermoanaerobaculia bacterium]